MAQPSSFSLVPSDKHLRRYLNAIRQIPSLDADQERELFDRYQAGDAAAGEQLVLASLNQVVRIAMRYHARLASLFDLIQEGNVGLMQALDKYDPTQDLPFSAYARYWIRAMILRFVMENYRVVQIGKTRSSRKVFFRLERAKRALEQDGLEVTTGRLSEHMDIPTAELDHLRRAFQPEQSLDQPTPAMPWQDRLASRGPSPEELAGRQLLTRSTRALVEIFRETVSCERELALLDRRLMSEEPVSLADLGRQFGVSRERMRQLERRLKDRLRAFLLEEMGAELQLAA